VRWVGNERGIAGETNWNSITPDTLFAGKGGIENILQTGSENGTHWIPAEVDVSIRPGWFYHEKEDSLVKTPEKLFEIFLTSVGRGSTLLMNVPPDKRGLIHERDVQSLIEWRKMLDRAFNVNLAEGADVHVDTYRGDSPLYAAENVIDENKDTYWSTDDDVTSGTLELDLGEVKNVKYVVLQEYIKLGQRVTGFSIDVWIDQGWKNVAKGTTIGYKRIMPLEPFSTSKIRLTITGAKACPLISNVAVY
jgi:alpha-L-fucosidase